MEKRATRSAGDAQFMARIGIDLRRRIQSTAKLRGQSMNTAIVRALEEAFPAPEVTEALNDQLFDAAKDVARQWHDMLAAIGQDPKTNAALTALLDKIEAAEAMGKAG